MSTYLLSPHEYCRVGPVKKGRPHRLPCPADRWYSHYALHILGNFFSKHMLDICSTLRTRVFFNSKSLVVPFTVIVDKWTRRHIVVLKCRICFVVQASRANYKGELRSNRVCDIDMSLKTDLKSTTAWLGILVKFGIVKFVKSCATHQNGQAPRYSRSFPLSSQPRTIPLLEIRHHLASLTSLTSLLPHLPFLTFPSSPSLPHLPSLLT
jgi:hypothetical protein